MDLGMIEDLLQDEQTPPTDIKVLGVGGAGGNAVNRMIASGLKKVTFVTLNTDIQALQRSNAQVRLPLGKELTGGLGAGGIPEVGQKAAEESKEEIKRLLEGTDMVFITAGMGGGTGTGAAPIVAEVAKGLNILTVAVVTTPFAFEGKKKLLFAQSGIENLRKHVDTLILIPNQYLLNVVQNNTPIKQAFLMADEVLYQGVQGISELITEPGEINIDFADVRTVMKGKGDALMGIGFGEGANRAVDAARTAVSNPLLESTTIDGAKSVLVNLSGGDNLTLQEYQDVVEIVTESCAEDALIIAGQAYNPDLGDRIKVTVVATGFESRSQVMGGENLGAEHERRRMSESHGTTLVHEASANVRQGQTPGSMQQASPRIPLPPDSDVITVNRWQDLQQQLGKRTDASGDYSFPAVLRYQRGEKEDKE
ncbi:cell division protein FtsZ [Parasphaerochaeta coccoides]|uniref:Cell division protein FtsZ n=1 Tax=Parasphaerochaeta coccoides (strain ATCC BAA-1237 / DSM 17374 / SPN1) TaxID=760011 RepID=F4GKW3_PARC1|nr:cell division protein FtsZ [Parasphaerochaeta coccoides]AEC01876.1 cell division protein FtsZ [Parasphaerochaeta coccoides DSM 17374]